MRPDLVQKFNAEAPPRPTVAKSAAATAYDMLDLEAQGIRSRLPGTSRTASLSMAREKRPDLYAALRS